MSFPEVEEGQGDKKEGDANKGNAKDAAADAAGTGEALEGGQADQAMQEDDDADEEEDFVPTLNSEPSAVSNVD